MKLDKPYLDQFIHIVNLTYQSLEQTLELRQDDYIELDLGCGKGGFTSQLAQHYPERRVLAADVMLGRLRRLVKRNQRLGIENMAVIRVEARNLLSYMLPDNSIDRLHVICPDPWPKHRHRHNRLISSQFLVQIHRVLKVRGIFHFSSDDACYFDTVARLCASSGLFEEERDAIADIVGLRSDFEIRWHELGREVFHRAWRRLES